MLIFCNPAIRVPADLANLPSPHQSRYRSRHCLACELLCMPAKPYAAIARHTSGPPLRFSTHPNFCHCAIRRQIRFCEKLCTLVGPYDKNQPQRSIELFHPLQQAQRMEVARAGTDRQITRRHGFEVVVEHVGLGRDDDFEGARLAQEVRRQDFDRSRSDWRASANAGRCSYRRRSIRHPRTT